MQAHAPPLKCPSTSVREHGQRRDRKEAHASPPKCPLCFDVDSRAIAEAWSEVGGVVVSRVPLDVGSRVSSSASSTTLLRRLDDLVEDVVPARRTLSSIAAILAHSARNSGVSRAGMPEAGGLYTLAWGAEHELTPRRLLSSFD